MPIMKGDVLELRKRLTKKSCTFQYMSGCYVSAERQILLTFERSFAELNEDEMMKYLEIAKKSISGTLGNNLLELDFANDEQASEYQQFLWQLKGSKLKNPAILDDFYQNIIENYDYAGNFLILVFYDVYDVLKRTTDGKKLDESEETYEYIITSVCPVELSQSGLEYQKEENRIGLSMRDWVVGLPDIGFLYPAFAEGGSDSNKIMYYLKNTKQSHPEIMENALHCSVKRTAAEQKALFSDLVSEAFGSDEQTAKDTIINIQQNLSELVAVQDELKRNDALTPEHIVDMLSDIKIEPELKEKIQNAYNQEFANQPPTPRQIFDQKLADIGIQRAQTAALQTKVTELEKQLSDVKKENMSLKEKILSCVPELSEDDLKIQTIEGKKFILVPFNDDNPPF